MIITEIQNENQADDNCRDIQRLVLSGSQLADKIRNETNHDACGNGIGKGLVAEECRQRRAQGSRQTGCGQYAGSVLSGSGEEEGIQENDISHRHERGQTCPNLRLEGCAVFFEFEHCFHKMPFLSKKKHASEKCTFASCISLRVVCSFSAGILAQASSPASPSQGYPVT